MNPKIALKMLGKRALQIGKSMGYEFLQSMRESLKKLMKNFILNIAVSLVERYIWVPCFKRIDEICDRNGWPREYELKEYV